MKKLLRIIIEFCLSFLGSELILAALVVIDCVIHKTMNSQVLMLGSIAAFPLSVAIACFISFFPLSRLYRSRVLGYLTVTTLCWLFIASLPLTLKYLFTTVSLPDTLALSDAFAAKIPGYTVCLRWLMELRSYSWPQVLLYTLATALMLGACWGLTRITKKRPLFGAFIAPLACLGFFFILSIFGSIPANTLFQALGLRLPTIMSTSILTALCIPALYLFDFLFSARPEGAASGRTNG